jgi:hypothetical protein
MHYSNFNFYDAFDFDDDTPMFAFQVATTVVVEEESNNQGRRTKYRGSILGHNIVNRNRKEGELGYIMIILLKILNSMKVNFKEDLR